MDDIINYGEKAMTILYGGNPEEKPDSIRLSTFYQKVADSVKLNTTHLEVTIKFKYGKIEQIWPQESGVGL